MKKYTKILGVIVGPMLISGIVYAAARTSGVNKLPWNGAGDIASYTTEHHRGPANAGDVARFTCTSGTCPGSDGIVRDTRTGLYWQSSPNTSQYYTWEIAKTYCANLTLGGFSDWRLPNIRELMSIVDYSYSASNYWYESMFTLVANNYWSSTTYAGGTTYARYLFFSNADTSYDSKTNANRVICTR